MLKKKVVVFVAISIMALGLVGYLFFVKDVIVLNYQTNRVRVGPGDEYLQAIEAGRGTAGFAPLLVMNVRGGRFPDKNDFRTYQLADPEDPDSVMFGCNWDKGKIGREVWQLNLYLDTEKYMKYVPPDKVNQRLNNGVVYCVMKMASENRSDVESPENFSSLVRQFIYLYQEMSFLTIK